MFLLTKFVAVHTGEGDFVIQTNGVVIRVGDGPVTQTQRRTI